MRKRPLRLRTILKWAGLLFCVQMVVAYEWEFTFSPSNATLWKIVVPAALVTAWLWWRDRASAYDPGQCRVCGYNLRGSVSGVCPECGTPTKQKRPCDPISEGRSNVRNPSAN